MSKLTTEDVLDLIDATGAPANAIVNAFDEASTLLKIIAPQPPKEAILAQAEFMLARRDCKGESEWVNEKKPVACWTTKACKQNGTQKHLSYYVMSCPKFVRGRNGDDLAETERGERNV